VSFIFNRIVQGTFLGHGRRNNDRHQNHSENREKQHIVVVIGR
jgi:hypothetical protein